MTTTTIEKELVELETQYWQAIKDKDLDAAMQLTDDTCIVTGAQGAASIDRKAFAGMLNSPAWTLNEFEFVGDVIARADNRRCSRRRLQSEGTSSQLKESLSRSRPPMPRRGCAAMDVGCAHCTPNRSSVIRSVVTVSRRVRNPGASASARSQITPSGRLSSRARYTPRKAPAAPRRSPSAPPTPFQPTRPGEAPRRVWWGGRYEIHWSARGSRSTGKNNPDKASIG